MIVCVCNNVTEAQIKKALEMGVISTCSELQKLGVGKKCKKCVVAAEAIVAAHNIIR